MAGEDWGAIESLTLEPLTEARLHEVRALHALSFEVLAAAVHSHEQMAAHLKYMRADAYADELRGCRLAMALLPDGALVATAGWTPVEGTPATARIRKVFVRPDLARRGIGRRMVLDAEARARDAGHRLLVVRANVNAVPLYHSLGYREERSGTMPVADGEELPVVFMSKDGTLSAGA
jgi:putative acetyltransferase